MCDFGITAIVTSVVAAVAGVASGVVGGISSYQQGKATQAQYNYQAEVNRRNAEKAQANADTKRQEGIEESRLQRLKTLQTVGSQQAAMAANGFDVSTGSNLDIVEDTAAMGELDALTTRYNYETEALAYESQAENYNNQANLDIIAGQNAYKSGVYGAVSSGIDGLGSAASVASKWYSGNSVGNTSSTKVSGGIKGDTITYV